MFKLFALSTAAKMSIITIIAYVYHYSNSSLELPLYDEFCKFHVDAHHSKSCRCYADMTYDIKSFCEV